MFLHVLPGRDLRRQVIIRAEFLRGEHFLVHSEGPVPGTKPQGQRLAIGKGRAVGIQEAIEDRQSYGDARSAKHATKNRSAALVLFWKQHVMSSLSSLNVETPKSFTSAPAPT